MRHTTKLALIAAVLPLAAQAQEPIILDPLILSGGLSPVSPDAYGRAYSVLTAEEIEARGLATLQDALRALPGVSVSSAGSSLTQIRIRGAEANHTLILIDGVEAAGGADEYILSGLETANIERIEVLRGPQSAFYGSNASAGVINIITRKGEEGLHYGTTAEVGNGYALSGHLSQRTARGGVALSFSTRDDQGYDQSGDGGEKDGIRRDTIGLSADWLATEDLKLGLTLRRAQESYDSDANPQWPAEPTNADEYVIDDPDQFSDRDETSGEVFAEYAMMEGRLTHRLSFQDTIVKQSYNGGAATRGETQALKYRASLSLDGQVVADARQMISFLAERQQDRNTTAPDYKRDMTSVALEYRGFFENGIDVQAGLRHDDNRQFEDFTSWNVGLSWKLPNSPFRLHGSAGTGIVNPSYYELYADDAYTQGNPGLKPEQNRSLDLGVETSFLDGRGLLDVTLFKETLTDEITYVDGAAPDSSGRASYINQAGDSPRHGVEVAGQFEATDTLSLRMNYTWLDAEDPDGTVEVRRPQQELGLSATLKTFGGKGYVTADLRHVAGNWDTQFWGDYPKAKLPDYTSVNLSAGYDLSENLRLTGRVTNLFDAEYSDVWGYASQGRTAYVGITAKW